MALAYLSLGSNLGNRECYIKEAEILIGKNIGRIVKSSHLYETEPWGTTYKDLFLNKAMIVKTNLSPYPILQQLIAIEKKLGRQYSHVRYSPRTIDIDILFVDQILINDKRLTIPHPLIAYRNFVLEPLFEICSDFVHPFINKTILQLLKDCPDTHFVKKIG